MTLWLVDDRGEVWPAHSSELRRRLGFAARPVGERAAFVVTNLGFISIGRLPHGMTVSWRPSLVGRETLAAAILHLTEAVEQRIVVRTFGRSWSDRILGSTTAAVESLLTEFSAPSVIDGSHFAARRREPDDLQPTSPIRRTLEAALQAGLRFEPASLWNMLNATLTGRYLLLDPDHARRQLRIMAVGRGYATLSQRWLAVAAGLHFEDQPDSTYAQAAAKGYWTAAEGGAHVIEDVSASVWWPSRGRTALDYTRLVLPLEVGGKRRILCTSEIPGCRSDP